MKNPLAFICTFFLTLSAFCAYEDITIEKYPDADAVLIDATNDIAYRDNGAYISRTEQWVKILTEKGRREESEISLTYYKHFGTSRIESVSIIGADGVERKIDVSATTKETSDNSSASKNIYDPAARRIVSTVPDLKVGDVLHVVYVTEIINPRFENIFTDTSVLAWTIPFLKQTITIRSPKELPLKSMAVRHPLGNVSYSTSETKDGGVEHKWEMLNSPQIFPEPEMPPLHTEVQNLRVSTAESWKEISQWYWNLCVPHMEKTNAAISNQVEALDRDIEKIYKWVSQEIRYMGLTAEEKSPGYAPHDVELTFNNRYGVCRDKGALLAVMLRIAGYEAFPVLIHGGAKLDPDVPQPFFNHAIAAVYLPGDARANSDGYILMDPTDESSRDLMPSYLSDCSYLVARSDGDILRTTPSPSAEENAVRVESVGALDSDGSLTLNATISFSGLNDNAYRGALLRKKPEERRNLFQSIIRGVMPGAELRGFEIEPKNLQETEKPFVIRLSFRAPDTILTGNTRAELSVPLLSRAFGAVNWLLNGKTSLAERKFPLQVASKVMSSESLKIDLGESVGEAIFLPEKMKIDGCYSFKREFAVSNNTLFVTRSSAINNVEFSPEEYAILRETMKSVEAAERARAIFSKNSIASADVHVLKDAIDVEFTNDTSWKRTEEKEIKILTYDGKKSFAELNFSYNPTWEDVKIEEAYVTKPDGSVAKITDKEINIFDCRWAAAAPRYPASKDLIVNLPSVEIGSTIYYKVVRTATNAPLPFAEVFYFDAFEPTSYLRRSCGKDKTIELNNVNVLKRESMQDYSILWRAHALQFKGTPNDVCERLLPATDINELSTPEINFEKDATPEDKLYAIRDWMAKNVNIIGPRLYEVPIEKQITKPETIIAERYATRLDYIRTIVALAKGAGLNADIVFAANDELTSRVYIFEIMNTPLDARRFVYALCRVEIKDGEKSKTYYIGTENEFTPRGLSEFENAHVLDPLTSDVQLIPSNKLASFGLECDCFACKQSKEDGSEDEDTCECCNELSAAADVYEIDIAEDGSANVKYIHCVTGARQGQIRKFYNELLPEDRARYTQALLSKLSQGATLTKDLTTNFETNYVSKIEFEAHIPNYATIVGDTITLSLPMVSTNYFPVAESNRTTPIKVNGQKETELLILVHFPKKYSVVEHIPEGYSFTNPDNGLMWFQLTSEISGDEETGLTVSIHRVEHPSWEVSLQPTYFSILKDRSRISSSRANRTIILKEVTE